MQNAKVQHSVVGQVHGRNITTDIKSGLICVSTLEDEEEKIGENFKRNISEIQTDAEGNCYVTVIVTESIKNNPGCYKQSSQDYSDIRMYEVDTNPLDPLRAFELYAEKLDPHNPVLFPKTKKVFSNEEWYTKEFIGKNTLVNIMKQISKKAGLSKIYTNHCVRASTVMHLYHAGVDTQQICSIDKHKSESTLSHFISPVSDEQKRKSSKILSRSLLPTTSASSSSSSIVEEERNSNAHKSLIQSVMPNGTFTNCTINFQAIMLK